MRKSSQFLLSRIHSEERSAQYSRQRAFWYRQLAKVLPAGLPEPGRMWLGEPSWSENGFTLELDYRPENGEAENFRRELGRLLFAVDAVVDGKGGDRAWSRRVSEYDGSVSYQITLPFRMPDNAKLPGNRDMDRVIVTIENGRLAPGCKLVEVEVEEPARVVKRFKSVCSKVETTEAVNA